MIKFKNELFVKSPFLSAWDIIRTTRGLPGKERYMIKKIAHEFDSLKKTFQDTLNDLIKEFGSGEYYPNDFPKIANKEKRGAFNKAFSELCDVEVSIDRPILTDNDLFKISEFDEEMLEGFVDFLDYEKEKVDKSFENR